MIRVTADTNILIYAVDLDAKAKHVIGMHILDLLGEHRAIIPLQCLSEFYVATTRKHILERSDASLAVQQFQETLQVIPNTIGDLASAMRMHQQHGIQFFDALLLATARRAGCHTFLTEDMQDGRSIEGITIRNPFMLPSDELAHLLS